MRSAQAALLEPHLAVTSSIVPPKSSDFDDWCNRETRHLYLCVHGIGNQLFYANPFNRAIEPFPVSGNSTPNLSIFNLMYVFIFH
jgi:hypothetical protein